MSLYPEDPVINATPAFQLLLSGPGIPLPSPRSVTPPSSTASGREVHKNNRPCSPPLHVGPLVLVFVLVAGPPLWVYIANGEGYKRRGWVDEHALIIAHTAQRPSHIHQQKHPSHLDAWS